MEQTAEHKRLAAHHRREANWRKWGSYLSERAWGTVREDYSLTGDAWNYFPYADSKSRVYRWNEDGLGGISDRYQYICFAPAIWNTHDVTLKERLFGLNSWEGNHGEDVKECYFYLDNIPTHSYMKMLYRYPQDAFPYDQLIEENRRRGVQEREYELIDTGIFDQSRFFDVFIEYAKVDQDDILIRFSIINKGSDKAPCHLLPTVWFRNTWSWGYSHGPMNDIPQKPILFETKKDSLTYVTLQHAIAGNYYLYADHANEFLFTENETNRELVFHEPNTSPYVKDSFHRFLVNGEQNAVNPQKTGTKAAAHFYRELDPQEIWVIKLRLSNQELKEPLKDFDHIFIKRQQEAVEFYQRNQSRELSDEEKMVQRQAFAGLLWSKELYYYDVEEWLDGDPIHRIHRDSERNKNWIHLVNFDVISMPDKWEYPWYASWDLAFHCIAFVLIDADFAKRQLILMTREWYMHPNGQIPAYEWNFSDDNPPVLAWAAWRVYKIDAKQSGVPDRKFLEGIFHKLLLNFTWWVNQKDRMGNNVFQGGFLGLDNISIFDRSTFIEGYIDQADSTAWMGFYCILMMKIALELSKEEAIYQDSATKFFEHFLRIASAMIKPERKGYSLWCHEDGFFYDALHLKNSEIIPLRIRSLVGLLPLFAVETIEPKLLNSFHIYKMRIEWFLSQRPNYTETMASIEVPGQGSRHLMAVLNREQLISTLRYMLDEKEFFSEYGIRSLSKYHLEHPYFLTVEGRDYYIHYEPGEAEQRTIAGGNSNWRGPIWFPTNFLIIESLQKFHHYYGDTLKVECPTGSGQWMNLWEVATEISTRLISLFLKNSQGKRPIYYPNSPYNQGDPNWQDLILFNEFFHGDTGVGLGASHQTGWTGLIVKLLQQSGGEN